MTVKVTCDKLIDNRLEFYLTTTSLPYGIIIIIV